MARDGRLFGRGVLLKPGLPGLKEHLSMATLPSLEMLLQGNFLQRKIRIQTERWRQRGWTPSVGVARSPRAPKQKRSGQQESLFPWVSTLWPPRGWTQFSARDAYRLTHLPYKQISQHLPCSTFCSLAYPPHVRTCPPSSCSPHPTPLGESPVKLPVLFSSFPLAIYFTHSTVYTSVLLSQFVPPSPFPTVSTCPFCMSIFLPCK